VAAITDIADGGLFVTPFLAFKSVAPDHARFAELDNNFVDFVTGGVVATITVNALTPGVTALDFVLGRRGFTAVDNTNGEGEAVEALYHFAGANVNVVPEPTSLLLTLLPVAGLLIRRWRP